MTVLSIINSTENVFYIAVQYINSENIQCLYKQSTVGFKNLPRLLFVILNGYIKLDQETQLIFVLFKILIYIKMIVRYFKLKQVKT